MEKIGLFGGTFDPPHIAHLIIAEEVLFSLSLSKIIFIPTFYPPHKVNIASFEHRFKMLNLAIENNERFIISDIEKKIKESYNIESSYSIYTIRELKKLYSNEELYFIIGSDQYLDFKNWHQSEEILKEIKVCVLLRYGYPLPKKEDNKNLLLLPVPQLAIKSSEIRERIKNNKPFRYFLPEKVYKYIIENKLYLT
ncbi:MAG: nicotinate-nucleotide adenylyltransferase [candidate division WOR-3 bacterium]|nr:nicotinate-nucleotide adenylyltransferase [candidate division WOR-3 bacterium]MDW8113515.1 nicotinate-nucleotide adenylyltransferase [candidate division WOR-3 bacterium]